MILLGLSAAFDAVDRRILIEELFHCGIQNSALALLKSYLEDPYQQVVTGSALSAVSFLQCVVPLDSVLAPILFLVYTRSLALLLISHGGEGHFYVDDYQIYLTKVLTLLYDIKTMMRE